MQDGLSLMPVVLHPQSVGTVRLRSSSPHDPPIIDPQFLTVDEDVKTAISGNLHTLLIRDVAYYCWLVNCCLQLI